MYYIIKNKKKLQQECDIPFK